MQESESWMELSFPIGRCAPVFPGESPPVVEAVADFQRGDGYRLRRYTLTGHVATHVDAPAHVIPGGVTIDKIPADRFIGETYVVSVPSSGAVRRVDLEARVPEGVERLFVRTAGSGAPAPTRAYLEPEAAGWVVAAGIQLFGIDSYSVDPVDDLSLPAHRILLEQGIPVLEMLELSALEDGVYFVLAIPLRLEEGDGSPVRVLARPLESRRKASRKRRD
ncbi:MAG: cyclase family protein [candidate division KSB1 bacterium]|nr:cyclase family protein [candidate division KSB1 bacterium]